MKRDPIVEEVRAIREQQAAEYGFDVRRILDASRERLKKMNVKVVSFAKERDPICSEKMECQTEPKDERPPESGTTNL